MIAIEADPQPPFRARGNIAQVKLQQNGALAPLSGDKCATPCRFCSSCDAKRTNL